MMKKGPRLIGAYMGGLGSWGIVFGNHLLDNLKLLSTSSGNQVTSKLSGTAKGFSC